MSSDAKRPSNEDAKSFPRDPDNVPQKRKSPFDAAGYVGRGLTAEESVQFIR